MAPGAARYSPNVMSDDDKKPSKPPGKILHFPNKDAEVEDDYVMGTLDPDVLVGDLVDPKEMSEKIRERSDYVKKQELMRALDRNAPFPDFLNLLIREIVEELSHQKYERKVAAREGKSTTNHSVARIASLRTLVEILNKKQDSDRTERLDLSSPRFQVVLRLWMEFVHTSMVKSGIRDKDIDIVFAQIKADMIDWERKVISVDSKQE